MRRNIVASSGGEYSRLSSGNRSWSTFPAGPPHRPSLRRVSLNDGIANLGELGDLRPELGSTTPLDVLELAVNLAAEFATELDEKIPNRIDVPGGVG